MNNLIDKYRKDELTPEELLELRRNADSMTDEEIETQIQASWLNDDIDTSSIDDKVMGRLKNNIDVLINRKRFGVHWLVRWSQIAAAILLPVSILCAVYFYRENSLTSSEEMFVITGKAERASITLPDGTVVSLNAESTLGYRPKNYNKKERMINFSGEGYFQVYHNKEIPFLINARGLQVKVLGTIFNLSVREKDDTAELVLEEGSVSLLSTLSNQNIILQKNQKAVLNQITGDITVILDENIRDISAWRRGDMVFRNTELSQVIRTIGKNYNMTIKIDCEEYLSDLFTGTLPINDLNEALSVIEQTYHLKAIINGREIILKNN
ncbi:MAG: FecR domain-containing protein [Prevotella sp.]|jgi:ferric-dicitrate binding protein FerR (iron transport regulator)|nr:FecR domain-containing protein [Prevotella sp.]